MYIKCETSENSIYIYPHPQGWWCVGKEQTFALCWSTGRSQVSGFTVQWFTHLCNKYKIISSPGDINPIVVVFCVIKKNLPHQACWATCGGDPLTTVWQKFNLFIWFKKKTKHWWTNISAAEYIQILENILSSGFPYQHCHNLPI